MSMAVIREETSADVLSIREVTTAAFASSKYGDNGEAGIIEQLREDNVNILSFVAEIDGEVVGHVLLSPVSLTTESGINSSIGLGLAPVSVLPDHQGKGIGSQLIQAAIARATDLGATLIVVLGDPAFYAKRGFQDASDVGLRCEFPGIPEGAFRVCILDELQPVAGGVVKYCPQFSV